MTDMLEPTGDATAPIDSLGNRAAKGFAWTLGRALVVRVLSVVSFVVLARLLSPADYGVAALANVFVVLLGFLASVGLAQALVQRREVEPADLDSAFWMSSVLGTIMALALAGLAWPIADAFDEPQLRPVLQGLAPIFIFVGAASAHQAVLQRRLAFDVLAKNGMAASLVATVIGVAFAFLGFGVWSLVAQTIVGMTGSAIGLMIRSGYRPGLQVSWARMRSLVSFSVNVLGTQMANFFNMRANDLLIGSVFGSVLLGFYTVAFRLLTVLLDVFHKSVQSVMFPVFSQIHTEIPRLRQAYLSSSRMALFVSAPVFTLVGATAPELVPAVFGAKWGRSVPIVQILCLYGPLHSLLQFNGALLTSLGRPRTVFRITAAGSVLQLAAFAVTSSFGLSWVAASFVIRGYLIAPIPLVIASRALGGSLAAFLRGVRPVIAGCGCIIGAVAVSRGLLGGSLSDTVATVVYAIVGAATYLVVMRIIAADHVAQALRYARAAAPARLSMRREAHA